MLQNKLNEELAGGPVHHDFVLFLVDQKAQELVEFFEKQQLLGGPFVHFAQFQNHALEVVENRVVLFQIQKLAVERGQEQLVQSQKIDFYEELQVFKLKSTACKISLRFDRFGGSSNKQEK